MAKAYGSLTINLQPKDADDGDGSEASASIGLELNDDLNLDSEGNAKSQFDFGEAIHIRCFIKPVDLEVNPAEITDGSVTGPAGGGTMTIENEAVTFQNSDTANTSKPITGGFSYSWLGKSLGSLVVQEDGSLKSSQVGTAVAKVSYSSTFQNITASVPPRNDPIPYPVIVSVSSKE
jgi:hypothetical protein